MESQRWRSLCAAAGDVVADMARPRSGAPCEGRVTELLPSCELIVTAGSAYPTSGRAGALCADEERVERLARRHEQAVTLRSAEGDVAAHLGQPDAADQLALWIPDRDARVADVAAG